MNLETISSTVSSSEPISGIVKYTAGAHASSINPGPNAAVTAEMQSQIATYLGSGATVIQISNPSIIAN
jgi:hypothetical protein